MNKVNEKTLSWLALAIGCPEEGDSHRHHYIPISWTKTTSSEHVSRLLCTLCFHRVNIEEVEAHVPIV